MSSLFVEVDLLLPMLLCACGVTTDPVGSQDTASVVVEPLPVLLLDKWVEYSATRAPILVGPYEGAPPLLLKRPLPPDDLLVGIQSELDQYPPQLLRERIDGVVVGSQLSFWERGVRSHPSGIASSDDRLVFLNSEYTTPRGMPKTLHHEVGHVLFWMLSEEDKGHWRWLSRYGDPASMFGDSDDDPAEDWAEWIEALRTRTDFVQWLICRVPDAAAKAQFVQSNVAALGVTLDRTVDVDWCVSYAD